MHFIIFLILLFVILYINITSVEKFNLNYAPIPYIKYPVVRYFDYQPSGYDSGTRSYSNPYFALEVAQGLDTN